MFHSQINKHHPQDKDNMSVGDILRCSRENMGLTLEEVSADLRIRTRHLESLEKCEWGDLPGKVYIIGFVRAYAEYLGLDGEKMIRLLKMQSEGFTRMRPRLNFPKMSKESRGPGWKSLLIGIILLFAAVSYWETINDYTYETDIADEPGLEMDLMKEQSSIPTDLLKNIWSVPVLDPDIPNEKILDKIKEINMIDNSTVKMSRQSTRHNKTNGSLNSQQIPSQDLPEKPQDSLVDKKSEMELTQSDLNKKASISKQSTAVDNSDSPDSDMIKTASEATQTNSLHLLAISSSWVQIKNEEDKVIFAKVLRSGDQYKIPEDQKKLVMSTGNAGALIVYKGTKKLGALGKRGDIIRGIELNKGVIGKYITQHKEADEMKRR